MGNRYYFLRAKVSLLARHHLGPETSAEKSLRSQRAIAHVEIRARGLDSRHPSPDQITLETTNSAVRGSLVGAERICCAYFPPPLASICLQQEFLAKILEERATYQAMLKPIHINADEPNGTQLN